MSCLHISQIDTLTAPTAFTKIYKEECTLCFKDCADGLFVCLTCFNGSCSEHAQLHVHKSSHSLVLHIKTQVATPASQEPSFKRGKLDKLEIPGNDKIDCEYTIMCLLCSENWKVGDCTAAGELDQTNSIEMRLGAVAKRIVSHPSANKQQKIESWQERLEECSHITRLPRSHASEKIKIEAKCSSCSLSEHLWMCLVCGFVGCGRRQWDGSGGNGHSLEHFKEGGHQAAVKLGTLNADGLADVYCYECDDLRLDPLLKSVHLQPFDCEAVGVEKSMATLQIEQNENFEFSMVTKDGQNFPLVNGQECAGIKNLGNSCYMSSVIQSLFLIGNSPFKSVYGGGRDHFVGCCSDPFACFICQACKLFKGVEGEAGGKDSISPWMWKTVSTTGNQQFSSTQQQDASEYLTFLFKTLQRSDPVNAAHILSCFTLRMQQLISCPSCCPDAHKSTASTKTSIQSLSSPTLDLLLSDAVSLSLKRGDQIKLETLLTATLSPVKVEASCECGCNEKVKEVKITQLPQMLCLPIGRFVVDDRGQIQKLDLNLVVPFEIDLGGWKSEKVPENPLAESPSLHDNEPVNSPLLEQLMSMGFSKPLCLAAIRECSNADSCMEWIFANEATFTEGSGPDLASSTATPKTTVDDSQISILMEAGFGRDHCLAAMAACDGNVERAFDWLLSHPPPAPPHVNNDPLISKSPLQNDTQQTDVTAKDPNPSTLYRLVAFVSHKGTSPHCGHYICHVLHPTHGWIICNDERIAKCSDIERIKDDSNHASIYFYQRTP